MGFYEVVLTAAGWFVATNIDGFVILMVLFFSSTTGALRPWQIIVGQYAGFTMLIVVSVLAARGLVNLPTHWQGLVGVLPVALGVWGLIKARHDGRQKVPLSDGRLSTVLILVLANGIDNISVYTPLFASWHAVQIVTSVVVFYLLLAAWCAGSWFLGRNKKVVSALIHVGNYLAPAMFVLVGLAILLRTGALVQLAELLRRQ